MPEISPQALTEVETALKVYESEVEASRLRKATKETYLVHSRNFVRWLNGDFEPGARLAK